MHQSRNLQRLILLKELHWQILDQVPWNDWSAVELMKYATRSGNWDLYIESVRSTLPWLFAYDRHNYSRYLTSHYYDLTFLSISHPEIYREFQNDNFSIGLFASSPFAWMEMNKVIETIINKDTKTPGGTTGIQLTVYFKLISS